jgi:RHS repeat-associated protein
VTYAYDALGRRTARTQGASTEQYLYGNPGNPFQLTASRTGGVLTSYYYDDEGALVAFERGGVRRYVASDQDGTPRAIVDGAGAVVAKIGADSFGRPLDADSTGTDDLPIGFGGGLADRVTGLVRLGLRDYDPAAGRFVARDPSLFEGSPFNLYSYGGSDPVGRTDPTGLWCGGFSFYAAVGGGISFCHKDGKSSVCAEGGVGAGGGFSVDPWGDARRDHRELRPAPGDDRRGPRPRLLQHQGLRQRRHGLGRAERGHRHVRQHQLHRLRTARGRHQRRRLALGRQERDGHAQQQVGLRDLRQGRRGRLRAVLSQRPAA